MPYYGSEHLFVFIYNQPFLNLVQISSFDVLGPVNFSNISLLF